MNPNSIRNKAISAARKVGDFLSGTTRYDSANYPFSAPSMARRKAANQAAKGMTGGPVGKTPSTGVGVGM